MDLVKFVNIASKIQWDLIKIRNNYFSCVDDWQYWVECVNELYPNGIPDAISANLDIYNTKLHDLTENGKKQYSNSGFFNA